MNYIFTFVWAFILVQMINFVLMSLGGGQELNLPLHQLWASSSVFLRLLLHILFRMNRYPITKNINMYEQKKELET
ncbi:DUF2929 family protein [Macrococcoides caseolyticum]|uniref:DUF2929 family protein n=1 Tax=Macrococcoides caseolyticum TaxID=69966 RepID=UPI000C602DD5|nr:DUF2929 family protein [Macrococcus caseolyticus]